MSGSSSAASASGWLGPACEDENDARSSPATRRRGIRARAGRGLLRRGGPGSTTGSNRDAEQGVIDGRSRDPATTDTDLGDLDPNRDARSGTLG